MNSIYTNNNDNELKNSLSSQNKKTIYCPKCFKYPLVQVGNDKQSLLINCLNCQYQENILLQNYLNSLNNEKTFNFTIIKTCKLHDKKHFINYCISCNHHLCVDCNKDKIHSQHEKINLTNIFPIDIIKEKLKEAHSYINSDLFLFQNKFIEKLEKEIKMIKTSYDECLLRNTNILSLLELLISNYSAQYPYYFEMINILKNSNFTLVKFKGEKITENIINYYQQLSVIKDDINIFNENYEKIFSKKEKMDMIKSIDFTLIKSLHNHSSFINSILKLQDGRIASCSSDKTIKIFNPQNYKCELTLTGHQETIYYISQLENGNLVSCSEDQTIKIWSITEDTFLCLHTIEDAHREWINKIIPCSNKRMASCSFDNTIKIWSSLPPYDLIATLDGHIKDVISIVQLKQKEYLVSASCDETLRIWNLVSYQFKAGIEKVSSSGSECMIEINNDKLIVGGKEIIQIINCSTYEIEGLINCPNVATINSIVELEDGIVLCGCYKGIFLIYYHEENKYIEMKGMHKDEISSIIKISDNMIVSSSYDRSLKVWILTKPIVQI